jgi:hypothetical protein
MALTLPDTANLGDPGHITDHNLITTALSTLDTAVAAKAPSASPTFTGNVALPSTTTLNGVTLTGGGLTYITQASLSGSATSVNGCFTASYLNYLLTIEVANSTGSGSPLLQMKLRAGGVDNSTNYTSQRIAASSTSVVGAADSGLGLWRLGYLSTPTACHAITVFSPQATAATLFTSGAGGYGGTQLDASCGLNSNATAFDGFTLSPSGGTFSSGTVRVYGIKTS